MQEKRLSTLAGTITHKAASACMFYCFRKNDFFVVDVTTLMLFTYANALVMLTRDLFSEPYGASLMTSLEWDADVACDRSALFHFENVVILCQNSQNETSKMDGT